MICHNPAFTKPAPEPKGLDEIHLVPVLPSDPVEAVREQWGGRQFQIGNLDAQIAERRERGGHGHARQAGDAAVLGERNAPTPDIEAVGVHQPRHRGADAFRQHHEIVGGQPVGCQLLHGVGAHPGCQTRHRPGGHANHR
jgi:hypothetical protein